MTLKILHLEDNPADAELVKRVLMRSSLPCEVLNVDSADAYKSALQQHAYDVILSDSGIPGYDGRAALLHAHGSRPGVPFIVVSGRVDENRRPLPNEPQPAAQLAKSRLDRLPEIIENTLQQVGARESAPEQPLRDMQYLVAVVQALSLARDLGTVLDIVRHAARKLVAAQGASFVLREDDLCFYAQEDAISPLLKGKRFALDACVAGWAMQNRQSIAVADIYSDTRVPHHDYSGTFVKSLAIAPIRTASPVGAIAVYWAQPHEASKHEMAMLTALADSTSMALETVDLVTNLELRVADRTEALNRRNREMEILSQELESFTYAVSHDLRSPLITIEGFSHLLVEACADAISEEAQSFCVRITAATARRQSLINDLLGLSKIVRAPMNPTPVDLSKIAAEIMNSPGALLAGTQGGIRLRRSPAAPMRRWCASSSRICFQCLEVHLQDPLGADRIRTPGTQRRPQHVFPARQWCGIRSTLLLQLIQPLPPPAHSRTIPRRRRRAGRGAAHHQSAWRRNSRGRRSESGRGVLFLAAHLRDGLGADDR